MFSCFKVQLLKANQNGPNQELGTILESESEDMGNNLCI